MAGKPSPARVLDDWTERDLTAAAGRGELGPSFEIDEQVALATGVLSAGRSLILTGESGIGKTALIHELVTRAAAGAGPAALDGRRVLQFSFRQRAATLKREWNDRSIDEGPHDVWLLIERADALQPSEPWLSELAQMELAWCRRVRLEATVVACELLDREPSRIVIHVEGPGAGAWLAAEEGVHRRARKTGSDLKARIEVVRRRRQAAAAAMRARVLTGRPRTGPLDLSITCSGRLEMPASGLTIELLGSDPDTLAEVLADLEAHREGGPRDRSSVARTYGKDGVGARDPRTGATQVRLKDALRGELGVFLDAWRAHRLATSSETRPPE